MSRMIWQFATAAFLVTGSVHAQSSVPTTTVANPSGLPTTATSQPSTSLWTQSTLTGDWGGLRPLLHAAGLDFKVASVSEYANNFAGGLDTGGGIANQLAFGADLDMSRAFDLGGAFHVTFNARQGRSASADYIGNKLAVQEVYGAGENFRLSELSYDRTLLAGTLAVKAGFYAMGNDFATTPLLCSFQNTGFCSHPQSLPNDSGWSDYPIAKWGGRVRANLSDNVYAEIGAFDVNPTYTLPGKGLKIGLSGSTGVLVPVEIGKTIGIGQDSMPGHYKLGGYYDSSNFADASGSGAMSSGRYGAYALADQMILSFEHGTDRGLVLVVDATISERMTAAIPTFYVAALVAQGPIASRPNDFIGIGYIRATVNRRAIALQDSLLAAKGIADPGLELGETIVELSYGVQVAPWMLVHPNIQYVGDPGAFKFTHSPDAWVFGLQTKLVF